MSELPEGFLYVPDLVTPEEETALVQAARACAVGEVRMRGQVGRRKVAHFGWSYGYESAAIVPGTAIPDWLEPLRQRAGRIADVEPGLLEEVLVTHYPEGAGIGWHKDALAFGEPIVGVSLLGACRIRFQRTAREERQVAAIELAPRSGYVFRGSARWSWQHQIPPVKHERFSITFRPLRRGGTPD